MQWKRELGPKEVTKVTIITIEISETGTVVRVTRILKVSEIQLKFIP